MAARKQNQFAPTFEALEGRELASANPVAPPNAVLDQAQIGESQAVVRVAQAGAPRALAAAAPLAADYPDPLSSSHRTYIGLKDLRKGDIILNTTDHFLSNAIKKATGSNYNHAAIYIGGGKVVEATGDGVHVTHMTNYLDKTKPFLSDNDIVRVMVLRNSNLTVDQQEAIANFALKKANEKATYNTLGVIGAALQTKPLNWMNFERNNYFCSQLVAAAYSSAGAPLDTSLDLTPRNLSEMVNRFNLPNNFSPQLSAVGALYDQGYHRSVREGRDVINLDLTGREQQNLVDALSKRLNQRGDNYSVQLERLTLDSSRKVLAYFKVTFKGLGEFHVHYTSDGTNTDIKISSPKSPYGDAIGDSIAGTVESVMGTKRGSLFLKYANELTPRAVAPQAAAPVTADALASTTNAEFAANAGFHEPIMVG